MFESTKTVCTPWKAKYIGCIGLGNTKKYSYCPKIVLQWIVQQGNSNSRKIRKLLALQLQKIFSILDDNGILVTDTMRKDWEIEFKSYNN